MKYLTIIAALALGACGFTPQGDLVRTAVREKGAQAYDEGLANSLWFICSGASVGSVRRAFGGKMDAYNDICAEAALKLEAAP